MRQTAQTTQASDQAAAAACAVLADHLRDAVKNAPEYARRYAASRLSSQWPGTPADYRLHPLVAKLVRELVLDELMLRPPVLNDGMNPSFDHRNAAA